jgi:predicted TPR repeat methyltransferase/lipopolysaccharide biosynthesis regulator YciM
VHRDFPVVAQLTDSLCGSSAARAASVQAASIAFDEALRYRKLEMRPQAAESSREALALNQQHTDAWRLLASLSWLGGNTSEAVDLLAHAAQIVPQNSQIHAELGQARLALNLPQEAIPALCRALELSPALVSVQHSLGTAFKLLGHLDEAETAYRKCLQLDPRCAVTHKDLGEVLERRGKLQEARQAFETALQLDPRSQTALTQLGKTLLLLGDYQAAVARYRAGAVADPDSASPQINLGLALRVSGDMEGSLQALHRAVANAPGNADAHFYLADALLHFGRAADAIGSAREATRLHPQRPEARILLGTALAASGDLEGGAAEVRNALAPGTASGKIFSMLGSKLVDAGAAEASLECFKRLLALEPDDTVAQHLVAARTGASVERDPSGYVRGLFDQYADTFDQHLKKLDYTTPQKLMLEILAAKDCATPWDSLDLGCGTGLFGAEIAPRSRCLVGVDVSPRMIARARELNIYTELRCTDLLTALEKEKPDSYDIVAAADVFVYVGRLDSIVPAVRKVLRTEGIFAFSTEAAEGATNASNVSTRGYLAGIRGRYSHTAEYLSELAGRNDFRIKLIRKAPIRTEGSRPVIGWLAIWLAGVMNSSELLS